MSREDFVKAFFDKYGFEPDPEDLDDLYPKQRPTLHSYTPRLQQNSANSPAEGLLRELNRIFEDVTHAARVASRRPTKLINPVDPWVKEFGLMSLLFLVKTAGYFIMPRVAALPVPYTHTAPRSILSLNL